MTFSLCFFIASPMKGAPEQHCDGFRCLGGLCIKEEQVCDGWPQCPFVDDESEATCLAKNYSSGIVNERQT